MAYMPHSYVLPCATGKFQRHTKPPSLTKVPPGPQRSPSVFANHKDFVCHVSSKTQVNNKIAAHTNGYLVSLQYNTSYKNIYFRPSFWLHSRPYSKQPLHLVPVRAHYLDALLFDLCPFGLPSVRIDRPGRFLDDVRLEPFGAGVLGGAADAVVRR